MQPERLDPRWPDKTPCWTEISKNIGQTRREERSRVVSKGSNMPKDAQRHCYEGNNRDGRTTSTERKCRAKMGERTRFLVAGSCHVLVSRRVLKRDQ
jgi:hypothetical protein